MPREIFMNRDFRPLRRHMPDLIAKLRRLINSDLQQHEPAVDQDFLSVPQQGRKQFITFHSAEKGKVRLEGHDFPA